MVPRAAARYDVTVILGLGIDVASIERIAAVLTQHGDRMWTRILTEGEQAALGKRRDRATALAGRWAAKEAAVKAFSGRAGALWHDFEVRAGAIGRAPNAVSRPGGPRSRTHGGRAGDGLDHPRRGGHRRGRRLGGGLKPVLSRAEMRAFEPLRDRHLSRAGARPVENAGRGAAEFIASMSDEDTAIVVVCGAGNNGGDGWVVGRHLWSRGLDVRCILAVPEEQVTGDARVNFDAYVGIGAPLIRAPSEHQVDELERALARATILIDGLFGTGLARPIEGYLKHVIELLNRAPGRRVALDIPSGVDADSGAELGIAVRADDTVTFGAMKLGLLAPVGARLAGRVHVVDLGVPLGIVEHVGHSAEIISSAEVSSSIIPRAANTYKHSAGSVLVVAGSRGKLGAALIVGHGALRAGAGLVTLASWPEAIDALESRVVELMTTRLESHRCRGFDQSCPRGPVLRPGWSC